MPIRYLSKQPLLAHLLDTTVVAALLLLAACHSESHSTANHGSQILHRGVGGEPGSLDPAHATDTFSLELLDDLYEGLTAQAPDGQVIPGVAQRWDVSADGLTYTFELRPDATWSNGARVRAEDFVRAWRRVLDPKSGAPGAENLRIIAGARDILTGREKPETLRVSAPSDNQLIVHLEAPAIYFPELLSYPSAYPIFSVTAASAHQAASWVSNGAYQLGSWVPGGSINLKKNPHYWDQAHVAIDEVDYIPAPDEMTELSRYRAKALDLTESVPPAALNGIRAERPAELRVAPMLGTGYYAFNLQKPPFKDNRELRQTLSMAIDRQAILSTILPFGQRAAYGFVAAGIAHYTPQSWAWKGTPDAQRIAQAKEHYAKAGYSAATPLHIVLLFNSNPNIQQLALAIADTWRVTLGVETELINEEYRVFLQSRTDHQRFGELLEACSPKPMTRFFRDGCCDTSREDVGTTHGLRGHDCRVSRIFEIQRRRSFDADSRVRFSGP